MKTKFYFLYYSFAYFKDKNKKICKVSCPLKTEGIVAPETPKEKRTLHSNWAKSACGNSFSVVARTLLRPLYNRGK